MDIKELDLKEINSGKLIVDERKSEVNSKGEIMCFHCGDICPDDKIGIGDKYFCCNGCKTVFEILDNTGMCNFYDLDENPGFSLKARVQAQYGWLDDPEVVERLVDFRDENITKVTFHLPQMHCAACVWLLENLYKFNDGITISRVNFTKKEIFISFNNDSITLRKVVELLDSIGYTPAINMANLDDKTKKVADKSLYYKLGFLGFAFGNVMLFTFPQYLGLVKGDGDKFFVFFSYLNMLISIPVLFYGGFYYLRSAWLGIKKGNLNIDVPISLGMLAIFIWSVYETLTGTGHGYFDSLAGLIFFLLVGKWFQQKTYHSIEFERDYKSYFPIAVTKKEGGVEKQVVVDKIEPGDTIVIKNNELVPADGILLKGVASIDYSFVTGEALPTLKSTGDKIYAGGKQLGGTMELTVTKKVSQSYLTQLWNDSAFEKDDKKVMSELADKIGAYFTYVVLIIAFFTLGYWIIYDPSRAIFSFAAVLIVACPCAVALSIPFTFGNALRVLANKDFYIKNTGVIESIQNIDRVVFDKTGTLTHAISGNVSYEGKVKDSIVDKYIKSLAYHSNHPVSRQIFEYLNGELCNVENVKEEVGKGISGEIDGHIIKLGSEDFILINGNNNDEKTESYFSIDGIFYGKFVVANKYREGLNELVSNLNLKYKLSLISGDNESERENLEKIFPAGSEIKFNMKPKDKLAYIEMCQSRGEKVMFFGDGLNDAGALQKSNVGIVITENINNFTPASDAIFSAQKFVKLQNYIAYILDIRKLVYAAYFIALIYNIFGLSFAASGTLSPVIAAILMPISSVSVVIFGVLSSTYLAKMRKIV